MLGGHTFRLVLAVAFFIGFVQAQPVAARPLADCDLPSGNALDLWLVHPSQTPALEREDQWACEGLQSSPLRRLGNDGHWHWRLTGKLSGGLPARVESRLRAETYPRLGLGSVSLWAQNQQNPPEGRKKEKQSSSPATTRSPGHIFWVVPAYKVDYGKGFEPLTPKEKFNEWAQSTYDPLGLGDSAFEAGTLEYSSKDGFCGYGHGWGGYGECFGALELDATDSSFIGDYALTVLLHQDPRYFRLGEGSFGRRLWYAISRVFVTYNDSGHTVFYTSALSGTFIGAGLSNFYYPSQDVGVSHTMTRVAIDLGNTALYNAAAEFWPDFKRKLHHTF
jgi:hypothetical protein